MNPTAQQYPCRLTVLLVTYNHEAYIEKSLNSILKQKRTCPFKILVADDASTDDTMARIKNVATKNPDIEFSYLDNATNVGITRNYRRAFAACDTQYVAVMEGDDYWTAPDKLQRQVEFLDDNRQCEMCSTNYYVFEQDRQHFYPRISPGTSHSCLTSRDLIMDNVIGNFSTCMYRLSALKKLPPGLFEEKSYDWITNICIGRHGLLGFIHEPMGVYRLHGNGTWSMMSGLEQYQTQLDQIQTYNRITQMVFNDEFSRLTTFLKGKIRRELFFRRIHLSPRMRGILQSIPCRLVNWTPPVIWLVLKLLVPPFILKRLGAGDPS